MRSGLRRVLVLMFALLAGMMGDIAFTAVAQAKQVLNFSWPVNVGPLNPHLYSPNQMFAQNMVYEPLLHYQADGTVAPWLAKSWQVSADGREYVFTLRNDVTFSNGEAFNAAAVVANFNAILENRDRHSWLELANQIVAVTQVGPYRVRLELKNAYYPILQELALPRPFRFIAPSQFVEGGTKNGILAPIGTGPWILKESHPGEEDVFVRNDHYWGQKPALEQINVKVIPDPNSRAVAFETGTIDLIYGTDGPVSPDTFERFRAMGIYKTRLSQPLETSMLALNTNHGATRDLAVRLAINHAIDKDLIIKTVLYGTQKRADTLFAPNVPYADIGLTPYEYDPKLAQDILTQDGWVRSDSDEIRQKNAQPLRVELAFVGTDAVAKSIAEIIQAQLATIGFDVILVGEEESSIYARQRDGRFGMIFNSTWGAPYDPHAFLSSMRVPSHADYQAQLGLPDKAKIDAEISQTLTSTDEGDRKRLYRDILTRLHREAVYLPLTYVSAISVSTPSLGDIPFGAMSSEIPFDKITPVAP